MGSPDGTVPDPTALSLSPVCSSTDDIVPEPWALPLSSICSRIDRTIGAISCKKARQASELAFPSTGR